MNIKDFKNEIKEILMVEDIEVIEKINIENIIKDVKSNMKKRYYRYG